MLNSVRKMSWQKTQLWGLYKTQDCSHGGASGNSKSTSSRPGGMVGILNQLVYRNVRFLSLFSRRVLACSL
jgi:hypothetical protein